MVERPLWVGITFIIGGLVASIIGQALFDLTSLTVRELAGMWLYVLGIFASVLGALSLVNRWKKRRE